MPKIIFKKATGETEEVKIRIGDSIMQAAVDNGIDEIVAECGGNCVCATCHCYVETSFLPKLNEMDDFENDMLDSTATERKENSRLSCQVTMTDELDGLTIEIPESQY